MQDITRFRLRPQDIRYVGKGLSRPECIVAEPDGTLWAADDRAAVTRIDPDGRQTLLGSMRGAPNGLAMDCNGILYVANIGDGKLYRLQRDGRHEVILDSLEGKRLGAVNFVYIDFRDRLWVTVSTVTEPRSLAVNNRIPDGYILLIDEHGPRKVAEGLFFTNEVRIDADGRFLYIVETGAGRVSRQPLAQDGSLGPRASFGPDPLFTGARTDGIAFDAAGNLWVTEVTRNALVVITPEGEAHTIFEDPDGKTVLFPASLTFGGPGLRAAYIGSIKMDRIACFEAPVSGAPLRHWTR